MNKNQLSGRCCYQEQYLPGSWFIYEEHQAGDTDLKTIFIFLDWISGGTYNRET